MALPAATFQLAIVGCLLLFARGRNRTKAVGEVRRLGGGECKVDTAEDYGERDVEGCRREFDAISAAKQVPSGTIRLTHTSVADQHTTSCSTTTRSLVSCTSTVHSFCYHSAQLLSTKMAKSTARDIRAAQYS